MDLTNVTSQLEQNVSTIKKLVQQKSEKIIELEALVYYYKERCRCLEADLNEMASHLDDVEPISKTDEPPAKRQKY
jgi:hypothetical protein